MEKNRIRDGKNSDPGSRINIPDPQHCLRENLFLTPTDGLAISGQYRVPIPCTGTLRYKKTTFDTSCGEEQPLAHPVVKSSALLCVIFMYVKVKSKTFVSPLCASIYLIIGFKNFLDNLPGSVELEFCFAFVQFLKMQRTIIRHY
jgi:hypothetical protein